MRYILPALVLIASAMADVSHLNNMYLPPTVVGHNHHLHQETKVEYAQATNEEPQQLLEPTNSLEPEPEPVMASQSAPAEEVVDNDSFSQLQPEDIRIDDEPSAPAPVPVETVEEPTQQQDVAYEPTPIVEEQQPVEQQPVEQQPVEPTQQQRISVPEEPQVIAEEFVPQTYGPSIIYSKVPEQGPFGLADQYVEEQQQQQPQQEQPQQQQYDEAESPSSSYSYPSGIDTQYGSNGGYVY